MTDIYETFDYGYDASVPEATTCIDIPTPSDLPSHAQVDFGHLPPVGQQTVPNCFVWASAYGITTAWAAKAGNYSPSTASQQASADYTYIQVERENDIAADKCVGGSIGSVLDFLIRNGGTPSLASAKNQPPGTKSTISCDNNWTRYGPGSSPITADSAFAIPGFTCICVKTANGLNNIRTIIASGLPVAYGTNLYCDFPTYRSETGSPALPSPYVGNGKWLMNKNNPGKRAGHCMMIIGYDDHYDGGDGAVLIQNSWGAGWGTAPTGAWQANANGFVWMAYATFLAMAEGSAFYISPS